MLKNAQKTDEKQISKRKMKWFSWAALLRIFVGFNLIVTAGLVWFCWGAVQVYSQQNDANSDSWFYHQTEITKLSSQISCLKSGSNPESEGCLMAEMNENSWACHSGKVFGEEKEKSCKKYNEANEKINKLHEVQNAEN